MPSGDVSARARRAGLLVVLSEMCGATSGAAYVAEHRCPCELLSQAACPVVVSARRRVSRSGIIECRGGGAGSSSA